MDRSLRVACFSMMVLSSGLWEMAIGDEIFLPSPLAPDSLFSESVEGIAVAQETNSLPTSPGAYSSDVPPPADTVYFQEYMESSSANNTYVRMDVMFLHLSRAADQPFVVDASGNTILSTNNIADGRYRPVPRITIGHDLGNSHAFELTYFGRNDWFRTTDVASPASLFAPGDVGFSGNLNNYSFAEAMTGSLATILHSGEANYFHHSETVDGLSCLVGLRYLFFSEKFNQTTFDNGPSISYYNTGTQNNLYGLQVGGRYRFTHNRLTAVFTGKAGIYGNDSSSDQYLSDLNNTLVVRNTHAQRNTCAFVGELGLNFTYQITDNVSFIGGYNVFWLGGIGRAVDQLDYSTNPTSPFNANGNAFLHGPSAGFQYSF